MLEIIEKLLVLQDRDRQVIRHRHQLSRVEPERTALLSSVEGTKKALDAAKADANRIESERKKLELDADSKLEQIQKYSSQQLQTKKNEEYRALSNEINSCKKVISDLEDQQIALLDQLDQAKERIKEAEQAAKEAQDLADTNVAELEKREATLKEELETLLQERTGLTEGIDKPTLDRYERLLKIKGENSVVGADRGICAGCHVKLPVQIMISAQGQKDVVNCSNCGRIIYLAEGMRRED